MRLASHVSSRCVLSNRHQHIGYLLGWGSCPRMVADGSPSHPEVASGQSGSPVNRGLTPGQVRRKSICPPGPLVLSGDLDRQRVPSAVCSAKRTSIFCEESAKASPFSVTIAGTERYRRRGVCLRPSRYCFGERPAWFGRSFTTVGRSFDSAVAWLQQNGIPLF
jgi:hypothetical protein